MTSLPITPPSTGRAGTALKSASPPPGAAGDFAALLDQTSARTAPAEGPKNHPAQQPEADEPQAAVDGPPSDPAQVQADPAATPLVVPVVDPAVVAAAEPVAQAPVPDASTPTPPVPAPVPATAVSAIAVAATAASPAQPGPAVEAEAKPADAAAQQAGGKLQIPTELVNAKAGAKGGHSKDFKNGDQPQRDLPPAPTLPPTADAAATSATAAGSTPAVVDPSAQTAPAPAITTQAQPSATPQTAVAVASGGAGGTALTRASVLQTAERVQELVRIATTRAGNARATLQLRPAELGQVDVHLRTTRNGLVATIAAHDQVGLDALQQAGNELRRTLEDKGVQLHSLDLQLGAGANGFSNQGDAREASSGRRGGAGGLDSHDLDGDDLVAEDELTITHAASTPAGALVDVQA